jgi:hypothetical protein
MGFTHPSGPLDAYLRRVKRHHQYSGSSRHALRHLLNEVLPKTKAHLEFVLVGIGLHVSSDQENVRE